MTERIRFRIASQNGALACDVIAEWREVDDGVAVLLVELRRHDGFAISLDDAAARCLISRHSLRLQLRVGAIYAAREREEQPNKCPVVTIACGKMRETERPAIEGRLAS